MKSMPDNNNNNDEKDQKETLTFLLHCSITSMTRMPGEMRGNNGLCPFTQA